VIELSDVVEAVRPFTPVGPITVVRVQPWATTYRVPLSAGTACFKACADVQRFEPLLTARLSERWPDRVGEVLAYDTERAWLLLEDAGSAIEERGNPPEVWLDVLPAYAELQRGERAHVAEHLRDGVPDLLLATLPERFDDLLLRDLPLSTDDVARLRAFAPRFEEMCSQLASANIEDTVQHDDLHMLNVFTDGERLRVLDWGDASISHPFASLVVTFRFLEERNGFSPGDPWFDRLRDAYLEPWGSGLTEIFALAFRVGTVAHAVAWGRQRDHIPVHLHPEFDPEVVRRALAVAIA
jgi:hypothetical protein